MPTETESQVPAIDPENTEEPPKKRGLKAKAAKYGAVGLFTFFLVKGLLWLIIPAYIAYRAAS